MALVRFTANLARHCPAEDVHAGGATLGEVLTAVFRERPLVRSYVLDDQGELRKHMSAFVDGVQIRDRRRLSDPVRPDSTIDLIQALSGG